MDNLNDKEILELFDDSLEVEDVDGMYA